ncbi:sperm-associated antigen 1 [Dendrobates tinctorius]|uniref:sperm-associated antigen 1 n=1 Tax=Dendrobates tinctorius TaxID=92724 RepID=UPI003CC9E1A2
MSGLYQGTTKTCDIPVEHLDYKFIEECKDIKHLEKILRVLRSGEEGHYPDLTTFCEKRIGTLSPNNRQLRKDRPPATAADFSLEDWREIDNDLKNFLTDMKLKDQEKSIPEQHADILPPIRTYANGPATNKHKEKEFHSSGSKVPRDYRDWDKFDIEKELSEIDKRKENKEQSKTAVKTTATKIKKTVNTIGIGPEQKRFLGEREKEKGNEAFRSGDYDEAISYYSRSLSILPSSAAYNNRAQAWIMLKKWQNAVNDCEQALDVEPDNVKALFRRAVANKNLRNFQAASSDLKTVLLFEPENPAAKKVLCKVDELLQKEREETAKKGRRIIIQDIEGSDEEHPDTSGDEKEAGVTAGGGETAAELIEMGNAQKKFSPKKGNEKEEINQTPRYSTPSAQNGVKKESSNGKPKNLVEPQGNPKQSGGKAEQKARTGSQEAKLSSQPLPLATQLKNDGNQLFKNGQFGEASIKYSEAIKNLKGTGSGDAEELAILYSNRAACQLKDGNCAECIEDCNKALELQPFSLKPLLRRAVANESMEKYRQAYVDYKVALQLDSGMQLANDSINRITKTLIDLDGPNWREKLPPIPSVPVSTQLQHQEKNMAATTNARPESDRGESIEDRFTSLKQEGNACVKKSQYREAVKKYTECLQIKPEECTMYTNRALCYLKLCQYDEARQDCDCALQRDAANIKALYRRAQAYKGLERYQDCACDLRKLITLDPGVTEAKTLQTEIAPFLSPSGEEKQRKKILIEEVDEKESNHSNVNGHDNNKSPGKTKSPRFTMPTNALEFEQVMNEMRAGRDLEGCAQLLYIIDPKDLPMFLSNKLDSETLLLMVQSLRHRVLEQSPALVYRHLAHLSTVERFGVVVLLLNKDEKDQVRNLLTSLSGMENENFDQDAISNLRKTYGL